MCSLKITTKMLVAVLVSLEKNAAMQKKTKNETQPSGMSQLMQMLFLDICHNVDTLVKV